MWGAHWETVKCQPWWISGPRPTLPTHRLHHNSEASRGTWHSLTAVWCGAVAGLIWFFLDDWFSFSPIVGIKWHWREWCRTLYECNVSLNVLIPRGDTDRHTVYLLSLLPLSFIDKLYGSSVYSIHTKCQRHTSVVSTIHNIFLALLPQRRTNKCKYNWQFSQLIWTIVVKKVSCQITEESESFLPILKR